MFRVNVCNHVFPERLIFPILEQNFIFCRHLDWTLIILEPSARIPNTQVTPAVALEAPTTADKLRVVLLHMNNRWAT